jgi:hypothetical protein
MAKHLLIDEKMKPVCSEHRFLTGVSPSVFAHYWRSNSIHSALMEKGDSMISFDWLASKN